MSKNPQTRNHAPRKCRDTIRTRKKYSACDSGLPKGGNLLYKGDGRKGLGAYSTLRNWLNGAQDRESSREPMQLFTKQEEKAMVQWCNNLDDWGFLPKLTLVKQMAVCLLQKHAGEQKLGKHWLKHFLDRKPELTSRFSSRLDRQRALASNPAVLRDYFSKVGTLALSFCFISY